MTGKAGDVNAGDRQRVIRKILAEYLDDAERQRILRKHIARILSDEGATETDRQEIVADIETAASIIGSPTIGAAIEDMVEAVESTPILNIAAG